MTARDPLPTCAGGQDDGSYTNSFKLHMISGKYSLCKFGCRLLCPDHGASVVGLITYGRLAIITCASFGAHCAAQTTVLV